jgi:hypothetical protein
VLGKFPVADESLAARFAATLFPRQVRKMMFREAPRVRKRLAARPTDERLCLIVLTYDFGNGAWIPEHGSAALADVWLLLRVLVRAGLAARLAENLFGRSRRAGSTATLGRRFGHGARIRVVMFIDVNPI